MGGMAGDVRRTRYSRIGEDGRRPPIVAIRLSLCHGRIVCEGRQRIERMSSTNIVKIWFGIFAGLGLDMELSKNDPNVYHIDN